MKNYRQWLGGMAGVCLGAIFIAAGAGKLLFSDGNFAFYMPPGMDLAALATVEIIVGLFLILGIWALVFNSISAVLITCFILSNIFMILSGVANCANCFGVGELSVYGALTLDIVMLALVGIIYWGYKGNYLNSKPWFSTSGHTTIRCA